MIASFVVCMHTCALTCVCICMCVFIATCKSFLKALEEESSRTFLRVMVVCEREGGRAETLCDTNFSLINEETTPKTRKK